MKFSFQNTGSASVPARTESGPRSFSYKELANVYGESGKNYGGTYGLPGAVAAKPFYARSTAPSEAALNSPSFARTIAHPVAVPVAGAHASPVPHAVRGSVPPTSQPRALTGGGRVRSASGSNLIGGFFAR